MNAHLPVLTLSLVATLGLTTAAQEAPVAPQAPEAPRALAPPSPARMVPAAMAVLVPDDAVAFGMTRPIGQLEGVAADLAREVMPQMAEMMNADMLLGMALPPGFDVTAIDRELPFGFAVGPLTMQAEPQVCVLIPTQKPDAIKALLPTEGEFYSTRVSGGYLGITRGLNYPTGTGKCALLEGVPTGLVGLTIDTEAIFEAFGPMIEFGMQTARMGLASALQDMPEAEAGMDVMAIMDIYFGMAQDAVDSVTQLKLSVEVDETLVDVRWQAIVDQGSPMAGLAAGHRTHAPDYMRLVGDEPIAFLAGMDTEALMDKIGPLMETLSSAYPPAMAEGMQKSIESWKDAYSLFGDAMAGSGSFTDEGMRFMAYFDGAHFDELMAKYERLVHEPFWASMGMRYVDTQKATLGSTDLTRFTFNFDVESLLDQAGTSAEADQVAQMEAMMDAIYGDQLVTTFARAGELGVMTVGGGDAYVQEALQRAAQPQAMGPDMARLTHLAETANPFLAYRMDIGQLMTQMVPVLEETLGAPASGIEMFEGTSLPLSFYFGIDPTTWTGGMMVDVVQASEFGQMMQTAGEL